MWEKKANKYVEDGLPNKEARLQADEDIREFFRRDFFKTHTRALEQELTLNNTLVHREILSKINDQIDQNHSITKAYFLWNHIKKTLMSCLTNKMIPRILTWMTQNLKIKL